LVADTPITTYPVVTTSKSYSILRYCGGHKRRRYFSSFMSLIIGPNETAFPATFPASDQSEETRPTNSMKLTTMRGRGRSLEYSRPSTADVPAYCADSGCQSCPVGYISFFALPAKRHVLRACARLSVVLFRKSERLRESREGSCSNSTITMTIRLPDL